MKVKKYKAEINNLIPIIVMTLVFSQPITVLIYSLFKVSLNINLFYLIALFIVLLNILKDMKLRTWQAFFFLFLIASLSLPNLLSINNDIIFGLVIMVQYFVAALSMNGFNPKRNSIEAYYKWFIIFMIPNIILGIAQSVFNRPIFIESVIGAQGIDINKINNIWNFGESTRSFGLFYSNGYYAMYLVGFICFSMYFYKKNVVMLVAVVSISAAALYFTYTRTAYVQVAVGIISLGVLSICIKYRLRAISMFLSHIFYTILIFSGIIIFGMRNTSSNELSNNQSLIIRYENWEKIINFITYNPSHLLFGSGVSANDVIIKNGIEKSNLATTFSIIVDNGYLAYTIYGGILLLALYIVLQYKIFKTIYEKVVLREYFFLIPAIVFLSSMPVYNMFGNLNSSIIILSIAPILFSRRR